MTPGSLGLLAAAAVVSATGLAAARPLEAELPLKADACWERVYDAAHLAAHPKQKVTRVQLMHLPTTWHGGGPDSFYAMLKLNVRKRLKADDDDLDFAHGAICKPKGAGLTCRNEWDAGDFRIERSGDGLIVRNGGLTVNPSNYDAEDISDDAIKLPAAPDDRLWRLERVAQTRCAL